MVYVPIYQPIKKKSILLISTYNTLWLHVLNSYCINACHLWKLSTRIVLIVAVLGLVVVAYSACDIARWMRGKFYKNIVLRSTSKQNHTHTHTSSSDGAVKSSQVYILFVIRIKDKNTVKLHNNSVKSYCTVHNNCHTYIYWKQLV